MIEVGILKVAEWPEPHRSLWAAGIQPPLLLSDAGPAARWRQQTIDTTAASYGRWLFYLREIGALGQHLSPSELTGLDRLRSYMEHLNLNNAPVTTLHRIVGLERGLAVIDQKSNRSLLRRIIANLSDDYEPLSKRERLQESAVLVELGFELMRRAVTERGNMKLRRATLFRDGLQLALLALRPFRLKNFSGIRIGRGRQLQKIGGVWTFKFKSSEMKNHRPIDMAFPVDLLEALDTYLTSYRVDLANGQYDGDALWVSYWSTPQDAATIRHQLCKWTKDKFGLPITPHLFRDCAATSLAVHAPDEVRIGHHVLGNDYATMEKHYNLARVVDAGRHMHAEWDKIRGC